MKACQEPVHIYFNFFLKARYANFRFVYHTESKITRNFPSPIWIQMLSNFLLDLYIFLNICFTLPKNNNQRNIFNDNRSQKTMNFRCSC